MNPLNKINANLTLEKDLWICVYYILKENPLSKFRIYPLPQSYSYFYGNGFAFKKNAGINIQNFYSVRATGSNLSYGIYAYSVNAIYPYVFNGNLKQSSLFLPIY